MRKRFILPALFVLIVSHGKGADGVPLRILPLGDSITHGFYTGASACNSYRKELKNLLDAGGYSTDFVESLAATLATTNTRATTGRSMMQTRKPPTSLRRKKR